MIIIRPDVERGAQDAQRHWGVPACAGLAQCILESQEFKYEPANSNNGLGIQALPGLPSVAATSFEYIHGVREPVVEHFAKFISIEQAFFEWGRLLATNKAYAKAFAVKNDWHAFILAMGPVYATAPNYANILIGIVIANDLAKYNVAA